MASIDASGRLVGHRAGRAFVGGPTGPKLEVIVRPTQELRVEPTKLRLLPGEVHSVAVLADGVALDANSVTWQTDDPGTAQGEAGAIRAGSKPGKTIVTAVYGDLRADAEVEVPASAIPTLKIVAPTAKLKVGRVERFRATASVDAPVIWSSKAPKLVQALPGGLINPIGVGKTSVCVAVYDRKDCLAVQVVP